VFAKLYKLAVIAFFLIIFFPVPESRAGEEAKGIKEGALFNSGNYRVSEGRIYRVDNTAVEIPVKGNVLGIDENDGVLYYISESEGARYAGRYNGRENVESVMPAEPGFAKLLKLHCTGYLFYYLAELPLTEEFHGKERVLVRFDSASNEIKKIDDVDDFTVSGENLVLITPAGLNCNGIVIPLSLGGRKFISSVADGRIVFVSNGDGVEVIDILSERNLYIYRKGKVFPYSTEYNVILEFNDTFLSSDKGTGDESMIYYQVTLNGIEAGRTETGPGEVVKSSRLKAETGKFCIITAERRELDKIKGRYVRVNNIYQPDEVRLFIPENRIIKVRFDFDGSRYTLNQSVYEN